jgi:hypothetical protein
MPETPVSHIRMPLDIKKRVKRHSRNFSAFVIKATLDKLLEIEGAEVQQEKRKRRYNR